MLVKICKTKGRYSSSWELHFRATGRHLPYGITQCYLPPDTSERAPPNPSHAGWYSIYLPRKDGRLSWPSWLDSTPAGSRTSDLLMTSPTPNRCTTKTTKLSVIDCGTVCIVGDSGSHNSGSTVTVHIGVVVAVFVVFVVVVAFLVVVNLCMRLSRRRLATTTCSNLIFFFRQSSSHVLFLSGCWARSLAYPEIKMEWMDVPDF